MVFEPSIELSVDEFSRLEGEIAIAHNKIRHSLVKMDDLRNFCRLQKLSKVIYFGTDSVVFVS